MEFTKKFVIMMEFNLSLEAVKREFENLSFDQRKTELSVAITIIKGVIKNTLDSFEEEDLPKYMFGFLKTQPSETKEGMKLIEEFFNLSKPNSMNNNYLFYLGQKLFREMYTGQFDWLKLEEKLNLYYEEYIKIKAEVKK